MPAIEDDQVLVRVHASSVNPVEWYGVTGPFFVRAFGGGLRKPKNTTVGGDVAGRVEAVGKDVTEFQPGDEVFGTSGAAWAEYAPAREARLVRKPANVSFEEAAAVPVAAMTALQALRDKGGVQPGQKVLINGASGGVGTYAVQLAKAFGADVTAVCSTGNVELARSLGADRVVDYTQEDFTQLGERHDLMLDIAGSRPFRQFRRVLTPKATVVDRRSEVPVEQGNRASVSHHRNALGLSGQEPDGQVLRREDQHGGPRLRGRAARSREGEIRDRQTLRAERGGGRAPVPRRGARPRKGHHHRVSVDADRLRDLTLELVEVESPTGDTAEVARLYGRRLEELGLEVELLDERFPATPIVIGRLRGGEPGPTIVLNGHLDTVPIPHEPPRVEDGRIYGRGTADMKGALACAAEAARAVAGTDVPGRARDRRGRAARVAARARSRT